MYNFLKTVTKAVKHWYLLLIVGLLFVALGIWVFMTPGDSYVALAWIFSISFLVAGIFEIIFAISNRDILEGWGWTLAQGILNALIGVLLINHPGISIVTLPFYVGFLIMFRSFHAIGYAFELKKYYIRDWVYLLVIGILGLVLASALILNPLFAGFSLVAMTGIAFIVVGGYNIYFSLSLKKIHDIPHTIGKEVRQRFNEAQKEMFEELKKNQSS